MHNNIKTWKDGLKSNNAAFLDDILADDCVFHSPAVHTPQKGKALTKKYLTAAQLVLNNESFKYLNEWHNENSAILEFELTLDGVHVNGIDIITWNENGKIIDFKVMMRPLKAIHAVIPAMAAKLNH
jgi:hypothetical protein